MSGVSAAPGLDSRSRKRARTDSASSPSAYSNGSFWVGLGALRATSRITTDHYRGGTASAYKSWLQGIDPQTKGKPYASYIGVKVAQQFETGWDVGVVCCITADLHCKSVTRRPASDAIYPTKSTISIVWQDNTDSVVDLRRLLQYAQNFELGLHKPFYAPSDDQRSPRPQRGGIQWSCSPLFFLRFSPPTGSRTAGTCRRSCFGKSGPTRAAAHTAPRRAAFRRSARSGALGRGLWLNAGAGAGGVATYNSSRRWHL
jgi:hypothetical protein